MPSVSIIERNRLPRFESKADARRYVWDRLVQTGVARFPLPPHGRIPNFKGSEQAAEHLMSLPPWNTARVLKINPDSPQRKVREIALQRGIVVLMPTPRLRKGFLCLDPDHIPPDAYRLASTLKGAARFGKTIGLKDLPQIDAIVTGSVAVTPDGRRCGKGEGYGDLEYAILKELGHPDVPVATTVHPIQIVGDFPRDPHDLPVCVIVTPEDVYSVDQPPPPPPGIDWDALSEEQLRAMPVLKELFHLKTARTLPHPS